jgi:hypothetical protein
VTQPTSKRLLTEDRAALASNATPAVLGTGSAGSATTVSRSDHVHPSVGLYMPWGAGYDGDLVFDGTTAVNTIDPATYTNSAMTPSGSVYTIDRSIMARTITIGNGVTLAVQQGCTIAATDLLTCPTGSCTIHADGTAGAANGTAGAARAQNLIAAAGAGGAGNTGAGSSGSAVAGPTDQWCSALGSSGGLGSSGAGGGTSGAPIANQPGRWLLGRDARTLLTGEVHDYRYGNSWGVLIGASGGGGGGGDGTNKGGGGGGGAGILIVNARKLVGNITFRAIGGAGGSPTTGNAGGGGGGGGGYVFINTTDLTGYTGPVSSSTRATHAAGGAGGTKVGTGVNGTAGSVGHVFVTTWK